MASNFVSVKHFPLKRIAYTCLHETEYLFCLGLITTSISSLLIFCYNQVDRVTTNRMLLVFPYLKFSKSKILKTFAALSLRK